MKKESSRRPGGHPDSEAAAQMLAVQENGWAIRDIQNPSKELLLAAVQENGWVLQSIKPEDRDLDVCLSALQKSSFGVIRYWPVDALLAPHSQVLPFLQNHHPDFLFDDEDEQIVPPRIAWMTARWPEDVFQDVLLMVPHEVREITSALRDFFLIPSGQAQEQEILRAVALRGHALEFVSAPSEEVQMVAVRQNSWALEHIKNPSEAVQLAAIDGGDAAAVITILQRGASREAPVCQESPPLISEVVQLATATADPFTVGQIHHPCPAAQLKAVQQDGEVLFGLDYPTDEACLAALASAGLIVLTHWTSTAKTVDHGALFSALACMPDNPDDHFHESSRERCEAVLSGLLSRWTADQLIELATARPTLFEASALTPLLRDALMAKASLPSRSPRASNL